MHPIVKVFEGFASRYPTKVQPLVTEMSKRTTMKFVTFDQLKQWASERFAKNPGIMPMLKAAILAIAGEEAIRYLFPPDADGATHITAPSITPTSTNKIGGMVNTNAGDGQAGSMWGRPTEEVMGVSNDLLVAFDYIDRVSPNFGGVNGMAAAFNAFHALEPQHFQLYRQYKKVLR